MSLINQMLRDLDARESDRPKLTAVKPPDSVKATDTIQGKRKWHWITLGLCLLVVAGAIALRQIPNEWSSWLNLETKEITSPSQLPKPESRLVAIKAGDKGNADQSLPDLGVVKQPIHTPGGDSVQQVAIGKLEIEKLHVSRSNTILNPVITESQPSYAEVNLTSVEPTIGDDESTPEVAPAKSQAKSLLESKTARRITQIPREKPPIKLGNKSVVQQAAQSDRLKTPTVKTAIVDKGETIGAQSKKSATTNSSDPIRDVKSVSKPLNRAEYFYTKANAALGAGQYLESQKLLVSALKIKPNHKGARQLLAKLHLRGGALGKALNVIEQGLILNPTDTELLGLKARVSMQKGNFAEAKNLLSSGLERSPNNVSILAMLGVLLQQEKQFAEALEVYQKLVVLVPLEGRNWAGLAISYDALQETQQALEAYQRAIVLGGLPGEVRQYVQQRKTLLESKR